LAFFSASHSAIVCIVSSYLPEIKSVANQTKPVDFASKQNQTDHQPLAYCFLIFASFSFSQASAMASFSLENATPPPDVVAAPPLSLPAAEYELDVLLSIGRAVGCAATVWFPRSCSNLLLPLFSEGFRLKLGSFLTRGAGSVKAGGLSSETAPSAGFF